jgi:hypothetical protein
MYIPSTAEIEKQVASYRLHFSPVKDHQVEWEFQAPPFVAAFLELVEQRRCVPSQPEFCNYYISRNRGILQSELAEKWPSASTRAEKERALIARLERAYPSFVRDVYLLALLRENSIDAGYDQAHDVQDGVDLVIRAAGTKLSVHVFLDTERARRGRTIKEQRHAYAGHHVDLIVRPHECKHAGDFWLPSKIHVDEIKRQLDELASRY